MGPQGPQSGALGHQHVGREGRWPMTAHTPPRTSGPARSGGSSPTTTGPASPAVGPRGAVGMVSPERKTGGLTQLHGGPLPPACPPRPPWDPRGAQGTLALRDQAWEVPQRPTLPQRAITVCGPSREGPFPLGEGFMPTPPRPSGAPSSQALIPGPRLPPCLGPTPVALLPQPPDGPALVSSHCPLSEAHRSQDAPRDGQAEGPARPSWLHGGRSLNTWGLGLLRLEGRRPRHLWPGSGPEPRCEGLWWEQTARPPQGRSPSSPALA